MSFVNIFVFMVELTGGRILTRSTGHFLYLATSVSAQNMNLYRNFRVECYHLCQYQRL